MLQMSKSKAVLERANLDIFYRTLAREVKRKVKLRVDGLDQLISPSDVEIIEVYHGFELPVEFGAILASAGTSILDERCQKRANGRLRVRGRHD